jgi:hypothetical protein
LQKRNFAHLSQKIEAFSQYFAFLEKALFVFTPYSIDVREIYLVVVCDVQASVVGDDMVVYGQDGLRIGLDPRHLRYNQYLINV